ncbi:MAG: methyltransferase domain-containing protein [Chitinophagaceae bacterium]|nr:methyltransferase domain-containing protein [Chitinophagaceae bacterium]MCW5905657.1 methyltransferase domain-containing protein [Chitinophagaceae bacterium]
MDNFINIPFTSKNLDRYVVRNAILSALRESLPFLNGSLLDIGCGKMPYKNYILENSHVKKYVGLDIENALEYDKSVKSDFTWDGKVMPFEDLSFDCAFGTEVLEHCPEPEVVLKETYRVLKAGGCFFFTVPFLWPLHEVPFDEYRYTPFSLKRHLENSGFSNIEINALGGWHASMAQMIGLWVRRSHLGATKRKALSWALKPVINYLIKKDKGVNVKFIDTTMITGLYGCAYKK